MNHNNQKQIGEEWVHFVYRSYCSSLEEIRTGTQARNLGAGAQAEVIEGAAYWLSHHGLLSPFFKRTQDLGWHHPQWNGPPPSVAS